MFNAYRLKVVTVNMYVFLVKQFEKAMTPEEKAKLFRAIDYQENSAPLHLPPEYVAVHGTFQLARLQLTVGAPACVLRASLDNVAAALSQRPSANALRYSTSIIIDKQIYGPIR